MRIRAGDMGPVDVILGLRGPGGPGGKRRGRKGRKGPRTTPVGKQPITTIFINLLFFHNIKLF